MGGTRSHNVLKHLHAHTHLGFGYPSTHGTATLGDAPSPILERSESSSTCAADDTSAICQKPADSGNTSTIIIAVCAGVPITLALIVLYFLHRRVRRRQRAEDANDPHKSLDFGLGDVNRSKKSKKVGMDMSSAEMEKTLRPGLGGRGLSMDLSSPYLLPAPVQDSRDSFHSMSRSGHDNIDPYRPVTLIKSDASSSKHNSRVRPDNASTHTGSSERSAENARLIQNAARMPRADRQLHSSERQSSRQNPPRNASLGSPQRADRWYPEDDKRHPSDYSPDLININPSTPKDMLSNKPHLPPYPIPAQTAREQSPMAYNERQPLMDNNDHSNDARSGALRITLPSPTHNRQSPPRSPAAIQPRPMQPTVPHVQLPPQEEEAQEYFPDTRRVSVMGLRPLPPDADPSDNPEQRANRIRSFYKEYFDDSKPNPPGQYPQYDPYAENYAADLMEDGAMYDPETGAFFTPSRPFAEPVGRRAMTPPSRGAASFRSGHNSVASTQSAGRPPVQKKRLPPPKALVGLPTPHRLMNDSAMPSLIDFAPPSTYRDRQLGRGPDSPTGMSRPYSPAFKGHVPLLTSFDDLNVMPSPHAFRKSSTFTALDFAPPPRFKGMSDAGSDSGSIRSNRSGISAMQRDAVRAGAYRVSRLPKDMVGTAGDLAVTLKPSWDMRK